MRQGFGRLHFYFDTQGDIVARSRESTPHQQGYVCGNEIQAVEIAKSKPLSISVPTACVLNRISKAPLGYSIFSLFFFWLMLFAPYPKLGFRRTTAWI